MIDRSILARPKGAASLATGVPQAESGHAFADPFEVLAAEDLAATEKRAALASWASDRWAVESAPALRYCPGLPGRTVPLDRILAALRTLDGEEFPSFLFRPDRPSHGEQRH